MSRPAAAMIATATSVGTIHCARFTCALDRPTSASPPTMLRWMRSAM